MATAGLPIEVDLTDALAGKTSFMLGVDARAPDDRKSGRFSQSLAGKQDWYGVQGGIWKPARLEARNPIHFRELAVRSSYDLSKGTVVAKGTLSAPVAAKVRLTLSRSGETVAQREMTLRSTEFEAGLEAANPARMVAGRAQPLRSDRRASSEGQAVSTLQNS